MKSKPYISVVIPTCNRLDLLASCLKRISPECQSLEGISYEVVVTDDGRDQPAKQLIEMHFPWAVWTKGPAKGHAANRNHGAAIAKGEWLVYTDDDCLPDSQWLETHVKAIEQAPSDRMVAIQGATIRESDPPSLLWEAPHDPHAKAMITANFSMRAADYKKLGGIDERYRVAFEDIEFFSRMIAAGGELLSEPAAMVYHPLRRIPSARRLAARWESRVVYALDQGASPMTAAWRLPWHVATVIPTRFRNAKCSSANIKAAVVFLCEWLYVLALTPGWVTHRARRPRSAFWKRYILEHERLPNYGF